MFRLRIGASVKRNYSRLINVKSITRLAFGGLKQMDFAIWLLNFYFAFTKCASRNSSLIRVSEKTESLSVVMLKANLAISGELSP